MISAGGSIGALSDIHQEFGTANNYALVQRCSIGFTSREAPQSIALADPAGVGLRCYCVIPARTGTYGWDRSRPSPGRQEGISSLSFKLCNRVFETVH